MSTPARPTVYPRDLHLAENLSPEQEKMRDAITKLARATDPHQGGYEHTETVETVEYLHYQVVLVSQGFAALLNAETTAEPTADAEVAARAKCLGQTLTTDEERGCAKRGDHTGRDARCCAPSPADNERSQWRCCDHCTDGPGHHECSAKGDHTTSCPICDRASTLNVMTADRVADRDREIDSLNTRLTEQAATINLVRELHTPMDVVEYAGRGQARTKQVCAGCGNRQAWPCVTFDALGAQPAAQPLTSETSEVTPQ